MHKLTVWLPVVADSVWLQSYASYKMMKTNC